MYYHSIKFVLENSKKPLNINEIAKRIVEENLIEYNDNLVKKISSYLYNLIQNKKTIIKHKNGLFLIKNKATKKYKNKIDHNFYIN